MLQHFKNAVAIIFFFPKLCLDLLSVFYKTASNSVLELNLDLVIVIGNVQNIKGYKIKL